VLAADSAVTLQTDEGTKVYNTANKLHLLVEDAPVGVMVSGSANLLQVPWETIIKLYRQHRTGKVFQHLSEYAGDLIKFIEERAKEYFPEEVQRQSILAIVKSVYEDLRAEIDDWLDRLRLWEGAVSRKSNQHVTDTTVNDFNEHLRELSLHDDWRPEDESKLREEYEADFESIRAEVLGQLDLSTETADQLISIAVNLITRCNPFAESSQVVVAGYGERELFPSLVTFDAQGVAMNRLFTRTTRSLAVRGVAAFVEPFAQDEMVSTFLNGIGPEYRGFVNRVVKDALAGLPEVMMTAMPDIADSDRRGLESRLRSAVGNVALWLSSQLAGYRVENHVNPVVDTIKWMPKEEMAQLAEALVNLTSVKGRVTMGPETVGGPVDVAVISKGDGFVWVQRKHYFDPILNPRIIGKYYRDAGTTPTTSYRKETE